MSWQDSRQTDDGEEGVRGRLDAGRGRRCAARLSGPRSRRKPL